MEVRDRPPTIPLKLDYDGKWSMGQFGMLFFFGMVQFARVNYTGSGPYGQFRRRNFEVGSPGERGEKGDGQKGKMS